MFGGGVGDEGAEEGFGATEDAGEGVVIGGGDGIELMVMAAGAGGGEAEEGPGGEIDLVIDEIHFELETIFFVETFGAEGEEAGGDSEFVAMGGGSGGEEITGELFADELIVGFIGIERGDDVIAVTPGVGESEIAFFAGGFGVAGEIEPVAAPAFPELGGGEEAIDERGDGVWGGIAEEGIEFGLGGGEADEIEGEAADEVAAIGVWGGLEVMGFEVGEDEVIDGGARPSGIFEGGERGILRGDEGPELALFGPIKGFLGRGEGSGGGGSRVWGAHFDPGGEVGDHGVGEFAAAFDGGHGGVFVGVMEGGDEETGGGIPGDDGGAGVAATAEGVWGIEEEPAANFIGIGGVTFEAFVDEDGADLFFEESGLGGIDGGARGESGRGGEDREREKQGERAHYLVNNARGGGLGQAGGDYREAGDGAGARREFLEEQREREVMKRRVKKESLRRELRKKSQVGG